MLAEPDESVDEHLTTVGELNPLLVFERFDTGPVVIVVVAVWASRTQTGLLKERGALVRRIWQATLKQMPTAHGARLLWHTVFFAIPTGDVLAIAEQFKQLLKALSDPALESYCLIDKVSGPPIEKFQRMDEMQYGIASDRNFREAQGYWVKLLNGDELK